MGGQCSDSIDELSNSLGFTCHDAPALLRLNDPFALANWTMPILELTVVVCAAAALWWSLRRLRRDGDPVNLVLWLVTVVYLLIVEPPLYFPSVFGIEGSLGAVFVHNVFTVQLLYDRLPLYIVALYPAITMLAYEIVRGLGVFRDRGLIVGAVCVGFVHHCLYEVFDQLGPRLDWWTWNTGNAINQPALQGVPLSSVLLFATVGPALATYLVRALVAERSAGGTGVVLRGLAAAVLIPIGLCVINIPIALAGFVQTDGPLRTTLYILYLAACTGVAVPVLLRQWRKPHDSNAFVAVFGPVYLIVLAVLWTATMFAGVGLGNLAYAAGSFLVAVAATAAATVPRSAAALDPAVALDPATPTDEVSP